MQRGLIRQRPREQRRPGLLLLDAESAKAVLPGRAQVSLDTYRVVHLPPPLISRVSSLRAVLGKATNGRSPFLNTALGKA